MSTPAQVAAARRDEARRMIKKLRKLARKVRRVGEDLYDLMLKERRGSLARISLYSRSAERRAVANEIVDLAQGIKRRELK